MGLSAGWLNIQIVQENPDGSSAKHGHLEVSLLAEERHSLLIVLKNLLPRAIAHIFCRETEVNLVLESHRDQLQNWFRIVTEVSVEVESQKSATKLVQDGTEVNSVPESHIYQLQT